MDAFLASLLTPLTPWFMTWSTVAAVAIGGAIGALEAFYEYKLKRPTPWPPLL